MESIFEKISNFGVVPVVKLENSNKAKYLAQALSDGGINCIEMTLRTDNALDSIKEIKKSFKEFLIGAGTVLNVEQVKKSVEAGASFIVSPCINKEVVTYCIKNNIPIFPGICTPTELEMALSLGLKYVKFFPAESAGGIKMIKSLSAPFNDVKFMPTGGINSNNLKEYLECKSVFACGGSWMVNGDLLNNNEFSKITDLTREAFNIVKETRK